MRWVCCVIVVGACALPGAPEPGDYDQATLELEPVSPMITGGGMPVFAAVGDVIVGTSLTKDGGATWATPASVIRLDTARAIDPRELVVDTTQFGLSRWNMEADFVQGISQPFPHSTFGASPTTGSIVIASGTSAMVARHGRDFTWTPSTLAMPPGASEPQPQPTAIVSNGSTFVIATRWGVYRSIDDGLTWSASAPERYEQALALDDGRFLLIAADRTGAVFDATGLPTGTVTPAFRTQGPKVACLGAVLDGDAVTRDLGATWAPLVPAIAGAYEVRSAACAGTSLVATVGRVGTQAPTYTIRIATLGNYGTVLPVTPLTNATGLRHSAHDTLFVADQAWQPGEAAWTFRPLPSPTYILADGDLLAFTATDVLRSTDDGVTWQTTPRAPASAVLELTSVVGDATLYGTAGGALQRSTDGGASWTEVGDAPAGLALVSAEPLVGRVGDTEVLVSDDGGQTWRGEPFPRQFRLAGVTPGGVGVTFEAVDPYPARDIVDLGAWHLWEDHGAGLAYKQLVPQQGGVDVRLGDAGKSIAFDADDRLYLTGGGVAVVSRSKTPVR